MSQKMLSLIPPGEQEKDEKMKRKKKERAVTVCWGGGGGETLSEARESQESYKCQPGYIPSPHRGKPPRQLSISANHQQPLSTHISSSPENKPNPQLFIPKPQTSSSCIPASKSSLFSPRLLHVSKNAKSHPPLADKKKMER